MCDNQNSIKWYSHFGNRLVVSSNLKPVSAIWLSGSTPTSLIQRDENIFLQKGLHKSVYDSFFIIAENNPNIYQ